MPTKRKLELFDPNKSDSNDTDFEPDIPTSKKSRRQLKKRAGNTRKRIKRAKNRSSDNSEEDESVLEESFSDISVEEEEEEEEEEEPELNPVTGRIMRKATKKMVNYEEDTESDTAEESDDENSSDSDLTSNKKKEIRKSSIKTSRSVRKESEVFDKEKEDEDTKPVPTRTRSRMVTLKIGTPQRGLRSATLAQSVSMRRNSDSTPENLQLGSQQLKKEEVPQRSLSGELSENGMEQNAWLKSTRGTKGLEKSMSITEEEPQESSSDNVEAEESTLATEIGVTDDPKESGEFVEIKSSEIDGNAKTETDERFQNDTGLDDEDEEDEGITAKRRRKGSAGSCKNSEELSKIHSPSRTSPKRLRRGLKSKRQKSVAELGSDFEPPDEASDDELSKSDSSTKKKGKDMESESSSALGSRQTRHPKSKNSSRRRDDSDSADNELDQDEIAEELHDLREAPRRRRHLRREGSEVLYERAGRARTKVDYTIKPLDQIYAADDDAENAAPTPTKRTTGGRNGAYQPWERNLFSTFGPFGGGGGPAPIICGPWGTGTIGTTDSDSSDDDTAQRSTGVAGTVGMTPTSGGAPGLLPSVGQSNTIDPIGGLSGNPTNHGKVKSQKELADADPLGVDQNVDFSKIGGLENHINQLKEMVQLPLLYPELFLKFHVTPPRGVLFHGPPGTGKTLLARALAASIGSRGQKITFYMRKGADALSKWVGEAERQLRLLFEEARKTQPSIIFFDEIDGLAPVRSSKQEQIHASIVSTLLALMDGMDGRGQVIVIGATNRPDNIDPALRRPGRFDREFYFPLPDLKSRKSIIDIHTKDWGLDESFKNSLAQVTKGYGGADLRALCTEAALNSIQRTYPQIYSSSDKLKLNEAKIKVAARDFMISVQKMIPSSERSASLGASPLPRSIEPLLGDELRQIKQILDELMPIKKKMTALQEAMYEQYDDEDQGFGRERMLQDFEKSRVFRPRLLIEGEPGMGQSYLGAAILNHFEGVHVQNFDLATLYSDSTRSPEAALVQLFTEVKRHKPSVIYLPNVETWYHTLSDAAITTFLGLLRSVPSTDPILVLGITDNPLNNIYPSLVRDVFGFSRQNRFTIKRPSRSARHNYFSMIGQYVKKCPKDFPDPLNRKKRELEVLELAPPSAIRAPTREEIRLQKKKDHHLLNLLKVAIQPIMEQIQKKYRKFRTPVIPQSVIKYIFDEKDPNFVRSDIPGVRPYEIDKDKEGVVGLREVATGKFFYNLETTTIEERLSNGFYARPKDFLADIRYLAKDSKRVGDKERTLKAQELLTNVEVDIALIEQNPTFADCENLYLRQLQRFREKNEKMKKRAEKNESNLNTGSDSRQVLRKNTCITSDDSRLLSSNISLTSLMNGHSANEITMKSNNSDDVVMGGTESDMIPSMQPPTQGHLNHVLNSGTSHPSANSSQRSLMKENSNDSSLHELVNLNSASNRSGKKTSDAWCARSTNGIITQVLSSPADKPTQDSDIPDTQRNTQIEGSQEWPLSQAYAPRTTLYPSQNPSLSSQTSHVMQATPPVINQVAPIVLSKSHPLGMANLLNDSSIEPIISSSSQSQSYEVNIDYSYIENALNRFVDVTHGSSIEELEQIYRDLMNGLWQMRGECNRNHVMTHLVNIFNETIVDIEETHKLNLQMNCRKNDNDPLNLTAVTTADQG